MGGLSDSVKGVLGGAGMMGVGGGGGDGGMASLSPLNYGQEAGQYLFGSNYQNSGGFADPRFQQDIISSERRLQPQYAGLDLANVSTWMQGLEGGRVNPEIAALNEELTRLQTNLERKAGKAGQGDKRKNIRRKIASIEKSLAKAPETLEKVPGLFELQREAAGQAGVTQRSEQALQQAADVGALGQYGGQITEAYRAADPYSAGLADQASALAQQDTGLTAKGQEMLGAEVAGASAGEQALASSGLSRLNAQRESASAAEQSLGASGQANIAAQKAAASAAEQALGASGLDNVNAQREAASAAERELNKVGMSLSDLDPTAQEAIMSGRGMEFAASTGELSPLEKRRATQSAREASTARGRTMDQSGLYGEMESRMAEELGKQEREIALGASLLGQEAQMRNSRLGLGANILSSAESMDQQRRQEQLQRQQFGSAQLGQAEAMDVQRRQDQLQREALGSSQLGQAEAMDAQRRQEQFQQQQFGASNLGQAEAMAAQRRQELLQQQQFGAGLIGQDVGIQSQRLGQAFGMQRGMAGDIGSMLFGRPSQSQAYGSQMLGAGMQQAGGPQGPSLFDPNQGINLALAQRGQDIDFMGANAAMQGAQAGANADMMGSVVSAGAQVKVAMLCIPEGETITTDEGEKSIDEIAPGDTVVGYNGEQTTVLQKHIYKEDPEAVRFVRFTLKDGGTFAVCDKHRVEGKPAGEYVLGSSVGGSEIVSLELFGGVNVSYDLLTEDAGYQMSGVPVNSMIEELSFLTKHALSWNKFKSLLKLIIRK